MYTYEDWLNDNMETMENMPDERLNGKFLLDAGKLDELCFTHKMISVDDLKKIREHQEEAFDMAVILEKQFLINNFNQKLKSTEPKYKSEVLEHEINKYEEELNPAKFKTSRNQDVKNKEDILFRCKSGEKDFKFIPGSKYKEVSNQFNSLSNEENFEVIHLPGRLHRVKAILEYLEYLNNLLNPPSNKMGLKSNLSAGELRLVCEKARLAKYIDCSEESFLSAFSGKKLPRDFKPINFLIVSTRGKTIGQANKNALRDFISICVSGSLNAKNLRKDIKHLFVDTRCNGIILVKASEPSPYAIEFEELLN